MIDPKLRSKAIKNNKDKQKLLEGKKGGYSPTVHELMRERLPELVQKYGGRTARDTISLFLYYHSYVCGDPHHELFGWAFPKHDQITKDTGIDRSRLKKLNDILVSEKMIEIMQVKHGGHKKNIYLPFFRI